MGTAVIFPPGVAVVDAELQKIIDDFVAKVWVEVRKYHPNSAGERLVVDGYASTADPPQLKLAVSCQRAISVRDSLTRAIGKLAPGSSPGIDVYAHGETSAFDQAPLRNQRAVIWPRNPDGYRGTVDRPATAALPVGAPPPAGGLTAKAYPGLGARKKALASAGGNDLDLAVAMQETEQMLANYDFGDNKDKDAANFGIFKQNWYFIRTSGAMPALPGPTQPGQGPLGLDEADWMRGAALNTDLALDVKVLHASQDKLGLGLWFASHRWGTSGQTAFLAAAGMAGGSLAGAGGSPDPTQRRLISDIGNYQQAVEWILGQIRADPALRTNDTKVWIRVPPV